MGVEKEDNTCTFPVTKDTAQRGRIGLLCSNRAELCDRLKDGGIKEVSKIYTEWSSFSKNLSKRNGRANKQNLPDAAAGF